MSYKKKTLVGIIMGSSSDSRIMHGAAEILDEFHIKHEDQITIFDSENESHHHNYKLSVEELQSELSKFNLTSNQAKIYIFLGKYGSRTAPEVCKALKIARTDTYHLLSTLQSKGIVSATFEHPIKFSALSLDKNNEYFSKKS